jgi:hypothetical protein
MKYCPGNCLGRFRTTQKVRIRIIDVPAGIQTEDLLNTSQEMMPLELFYSKY